jgi:hypothetical protein
MRASVLWAVVLLSIACASGPERKAGEEEYAPIEVVDLILEMPPTDHLLSVAASFVDQPRPTSCAYGRPFRVDLSIRRGDAPDETKLDLLVQCAWRARGALSPARLFVHERDGKLAVGSGYDDPHRSEPIPPPAPSAPVTATNDPESLAARMSGATLISRVAPDIPSAFRTGEGLPPYFVKVCVRRDGTAGRIRLSSARHHPVIDARVFDAVRRWRFEPFRLHGKPIERCTDMRLTP